MFALAVVGFLVAFGLVLADRRKPAIAIAVVLMGVCIAFYYLHNYEVDWPW